MELSGVVKMKKMRKFSIGGPSDSVERADPLSDESSPKGKPLEIAAASFRMPEPEPEPKPEPKAVAARPSVPKVVTAKMMRDEGFDNLRDYMNSKLGLVRRRESQPPAEEMYPIKDAPVGAGRGKVAPPTVGEVQSMAGKLKRELKTKNISDTGMRELATEKLVGWADDEKGQKFRMYKKGGRINLADCKVNTVAKSGRKSGW